MKRLRLIDGAQVKVQLQFEPRDLWVGIFWRTTQRLPPPVWILHVYLCLLPTLPLHLTLLCRPRARPPRPAAPS